jgi:hypothetical protein
VASPRLGSATPSNPNLLSSDLPVPLNGFVGVGQFAFPQTFATSRFDGIPLQFDPSCDLTMPGPSCLEDPQDFGLRVPVTRTTGFGQDCKLERGS